MKTAHGTFQQHTPRNREGAGTACAVTQGNLADSPPAAAGTPVMAYHQTGRLGFSGALEG